MKENTKWYWEQKQKQQVIVVPTCNILHPCIDVMVVKGVHNNPNSIFNRNQSIQVLKINPIYLTESDNDCFFDEIVSREKFEYKGKVVLKMKNNKVVK